MSQIEIQEESSLQFFTPSFKSLEFRHVLLNKNAKKIKVNV